MKILVAILRIAKFSKTEYLREIPTPIPLARFLASIMAIEAQSSSVMKALQMVDLYLTNFPDDQLFFFGHEGVLYEVVRLAEAPPSSQSLSPKPQVFNMPSGISRSEFRYASTFSAMPEDKHLSVPPLFYSRHSSSSHPLSHSSVSTSSGARDQLFYRAQHHKAKYTAEETGSSTKEQEPLDHIQKSAVDLDSVQFEELAEVLLKQLAALYSHKGKPLTSFELSESGPMVCVTVCLALLSKIFLSSSGHPVLLPLVKRLQQSLDLLEGFEVLTAVASTADDVPQNCANVSVHAIATFLAFNNCLQPKIIKSQDDERLGRPSCSGRLQEMLAAFAVVAGLPATSSSTLSTFAPEVSMEINITCRDVMELNKQCMVLCPIDQDSETTSPNQKPSLEVQPAQDEPQMGAPTWHGTRITTTLTSFPSSAPVGDLSHMVGGGTELHSSEHTYLGAVKAEPEDWLLDYSLGRPSRTPDAGVFGMIYKHNLNSRDSCCNIRTSGYTDSSKKAEGLVPVSNKDSSSFDQSSGVEDQGISALIVEGVQQDSMLRLHRALHRSNSDHKDLVHSKRKVPSANQALSDTMGKKNCKISSKLNQQLKEPKIATRANLSSVGPLPVVPPVQDNLESWKFFEGTKKPFPLKKSTLESNSTLQHCGEEDYESDCDLGSNQLQVVDSTSTTIYVTNIPHDVLEIEVEGMISSFVPFQQAFLLGRSKPLLLVRMKTREEAVNLLKGLNGQLWGERNIRCEWAQSNFHLFEEFQNSSESSIKGVPWCRYLIPSGPTPWWS
ncbi:hypothetical protein BY996DRAFT_6416414 [Phakopsora pachyrhizi]|nr:hypothetical protein BY996DRAFT_6416414 [Phakopsora pachyrhizi]